MSRRWMDGLIEQEWVGVCVCVVVGVWSDKGINILIVSGNMLDLERTPTQIAAKPLQT